ncbi:hypothetical protein [Encephalitozoon cuniculi GB-M1]|uniref:Uncharacterized protein n=1 Tax=Encephalitozoon cuniculi (strain GB-M1) TaxID=284813 RepID=Q8SU54_ENCCU|nr:uncharacterized protein ECU11_0740 [Encephalitozoon cuniculi GB-M1]CAD25984.3 hypothetical protein [Encephalitozoon cuniculi GB-M1]
MPGMDAEFISGVVVSYSKLLREMRAIRKELKEVLGTVRAVLSLVGTSCGAKHVSSKPPGCRCLDNPVKTCFDETALSATYKKALESRVVLAERREGSRSKEMGSKRQVRKSSLGTADHHLTFFQEVERDVCHAQWEEDGSCWAQPLV